MVELNSEHRWRWFLRAAVVSAVALFGAIYAFILAVDPHDHLSISLPITRAPINTNQRFSYPAIARNPKFNSVVVGTSTARLFRPPLLEEVFGGKFANLAMNSSTAYEQSRILELFMRNRGDIRTVIFGLDIVWCKSGKNFQRYTFRTFPEWLYDESDLNDYLSLFNAHTLEQAIRQLEYQLEKRQPRYGFDGYENFLPPQNEYDLKRAQLHLYGPKGPRSRKNTESHSMDLEAEQTGWRFPTHPLLERLLKRLPKSATVLLVFVPYHYFSQPVPGSVEATSWAECKDRIQRIASSHPRAFIIDFMIDSELTRDDRNYWDPLHVTIETADRLVTWMAQAIAGGEQASGPFRHIPVVNSVDR